MNLNEFFSTPYHERQIIAFIPDDLLSKAKSADDKADDRIGKTLSAAAVGYGLRGIASAIADGLILPIGGFLAVGLAAPIVVVWLLRRKNVKSKLLLLPYSFSEKLSLIHPPMNDQVYVGHPHEPRIYYPTAEFHRIMFENKFSELLRLLTSLGAVRIKAHYIKGYKRDLGFETIFGIAADQFSLKFDKTQSQERSVVYEAELDNLSKPDPPANLLWYAHENTWKELTRERLSNGLRKVRVNLEYAEDFGVNAELKAKIKHYDLNLGGKFVNLSKTVWDFEVEFNTLRPKK